MKKLALVGVLSMFSVLGIVGILAPARATGDGLPVGTIIAWGGPSNSVPSGWMLCNGKAINRATCKDLFAVIGTRWGGSGSAFNLPDFRGRFLRGDDAGTGRDPDASKRSPSAPGGNTAGVGSVQDDSLQNHSHDQGPHYHQYRVPGHAAFITDLGTGIGVHKSQLFDSGSGEAKAKIYGATAFGTNSRIKVGEESRPKNAAVNFIIKVK